MDAYLASVARDCLNGMVLIHVESEVALLFIWVKGAACY